MAQFIIINLVETIPYVIFFLFSTYDEDSKALFPLRIVLALTQRSTGLLNSLAFARNERRTFAAKLRNSFKSISKSSLSSKDNDQSLLGNP